MTDAGVARLKPENSEYTVWDARAAGFGVRVRPSGSRSYVCCCKSGDRARRFSLGPSALKSVSSARREYLALAGTEAPAPRSSPTLFREFVAAPWKTAWYDRYKPSTRKGVNCILETQLLPVFGSMALHRITRIEIENWFDAYSLTAPDGANKALKTLRQILNYAIACACIEANPARCVKPNPRRKLTRFLSREEIRRLHQVLDGYADERTGRQADIIRLLLLTGCRKGEIVGLRWRDFDGDILNLVDSKTGPRKVLLNAAARRILESQPRMESPYVFPSPSNPARPRSDNLPLWYRVRQQAGIEDVRLHDLRHTFASQAVLRGVPLPVVARLLGHKQVRMTLRYAHVADREVEAAAERVGAAIAAAMKGKQPTGSPASSCPAIDVPEHSR